VYRNKLVAAFTDVSGQVHYARLDTADPYLPWVGGGVVRTGDATVRRPALGQLNRRSYLATADYGLPNFGEDLFAAVVEEADQSVSYINFSRAIFLNESTAQLSFWDSNERTDGNICQGDSGDATLISNPFTDGRPIYSEVGFNIWMLPDWLSSHIFQDAGERGCLDGNVSGRFPPPCSSTGYPVIYRPSGGIFICHGVWVTQADRYIRVWEEFGHSLGGMLGFHDNPPGPAQWNEDATGIALADLNEGFNLFGESLGASCPLGVDATAPGNPGRCRGFTGYAGNYDTGTRQHSYMYVIMYYLWNGDLLREWIERDLDVGVDLLQRKYNWIRDHIFHGLEYHGNCEPRDLWNVDCRPDVQLTCGSSWTHHNNLGTDNVEGYLCNGYDYGGPEVAHAFRFPLDATVTVNVTGLTADLDLLLLTPPIDLCDSASCTHSSVNGGTSDESLTFSAVAGNTYYLVVDGYMGAESGYTISVGCETAPPGAVPQTGAPLMLYHDPSGVDIDLVWGVDCGTSLDFAVYRGWLGAWDSHEAELCSTGGVPWTIVPEHPDSYYFLVTAHNGLYEGGYGVDSSGAPRPPAYVSCTGAWDDAACP
jgi:hypothetical protein